MKMFFCPNHGIVAASSLCIALLLGACSQTPDRPEPPPAPSGLAEDFEKRVIRYTVQPGDMLGDIALEFTGEHRSWQAIATYNGIDDPRRLGEGVELEIPMALIRGYDPENPRESLAAARSVLAREAEERAAREANDRAAKASAQTETQQVVAQRAEPARESATDAVPDPQTADAVAEERSVAAAATGEEAGDALQATAADTDTTAPVEDAAGAVLQEHDGDPDEPATVTTRSGAPVSVASPETPTTEVELSAVERPPAFDAVPLTGEDEGSAAPSRRSVRVIGTYYPKGIYAQPTASAELLMRVAPGSEFVLDRTVDNWYRVITEDGTGYIRSSDARIVEARP